MTQIIHQSPLGKKSAPATAYSPSLLFPIERRIKREEIGISSPLPFKGVDIWNSYEFSWLNAKGKPRVALIECHIPSHSHSLIESKSFKLYLNSFSQTRFSTIEDIIDTLHHDISGAVGSSISIKVLQLQELVGQKLEEFSGICLDGLDIETDQYTLDPSLLQCSEEIVEEDVYSHLLKSNCLITGQPDWASILIRYRGKRIDHPSLLKYLISFRQHCEFHEHCVERIFMDICHWCKPRQLTVYARYTRRGGLDINPFRSNFEAFPKNFREVRQ
ncbi:MAG: NADPH-dependent 7-cyano-7-deazaguanine reductase QueF [Waddliaceae bacterium]